MRLNMLLTNSGSSSARLAMRSLLLTHLVSSSLVTLPSPSASIFLNACSGVSRCRRSFFSSWAIAGVEKARARTATTTIFSQRIGLSYGEKKVVPFAYGSVLLSTPALEHSDCGFHHFLL